MFSLIKGKFFKEAVAILLLAISAFFFLALLSHNPEDPSFNRFLSDKTISVKNHGGIIGAYTSDILILFFGIGSYFLPFTLLWISGKLFFEKVTLRPLVTIAGGTSGIFLVCTFISLIFSTHTSGGRKISPGGIIGLGISGQLKAFLSYWGALIIVLALMIISFSMVTKISIKEIFTSIFNFLCFIYKNIRKVDFLFPLKILKKIDLSKEPKNEEKKKGKSRPKSKTKVSLNNEDNAAGHEEKPEIIEESFDSSSQEILPVAGKYTLPPLSFLDPPVRSENPPDSEELATNSKILIEKLNAFNIEGTIKNVLPGPVITMYELEPGTGVKVSRILNLTDDLALAMKSVSIRIHAPVPGKSVVGIELPNKNRDPVGLIDILKSKAYKENSHKLTLALGKDTTGKPVVTNLATIPHLLIAGATGSGKSVGVNAMITSILFNATPDEVKFIMIDPKMLELSIYDGIPHLIAPVVTNPKKAANALRWAVEEMERRYKLLSAVGTRNIDGYNEMIQGKINEKNKTEPDAESDGANHEKNTRNGKLPYIVIIIDELADLMMVASKDVEDSLARLAQMARAAGIHLLVATQRPSVDVLTGLIKANFPSRISFKVTSRVDSRTILDSIGSERLLGKGDMLFLAPGTSKMERIHGAYVSETEIKKIVSFLKKQDKPVYDDTILAIKDSEPVQEEEGESDELYDQAVALVAKTRQASISMIQRRLRIGYNRSARLVEIMEKQGLVGPSDGSKPREVYVRDIDDAEGIN